MSGRTASLLVRHVLWRQLTSAANGSNAMAQATTMAGSGMPALTRAPTNLLSIPRTNLGARTYYRGSDMTGMVGGVVSVKHYALAAWISALRHSYWQICGVMQAFPPPGNFGVVVVPEKYTYLVERSVYFWARM
eukprot:scaffold35225_cov19-Tisochrysis_lutea.AAC.2